MAIDPHALIRLPIPSTRTDYAARDAALYALGVGTGFDPLDPAQLVYLVGEQPRILPSFATVLGYEGFWAEDPATGIDTSAVLHASQRVTIHRPLPASGSVTRDNAILGVTDKGEGRGALVRLREHVRDAASRELLATLESAVMCTADGGCGDAGEPVVRQPLVPISHPDICVDIATSPQQALLYQLSGDRYPLHLDPEVAQRAGFDRPILQGLSTFGAACRVLVASLCDNDPERMTMQECRFTGVVFPGDRLRLELWPINPGEARYRVRLVNRDAVALDDGLFRWRA
jgi:acyl dehydratase